ncbi:AMSH-like ubiquitin thioesterase 1 [Gracilariopsis chorda]|uniref:AMSH-like ubiquitin thioesterase 1 n=1 Tax=Gracilariopsis chorda TaxID=448386 RepID=A0A2V3IE58_9FLOR|nr:AMSH-like ubiquitin thioesterase 1 [Gracilariopsis chorda]|eukprot:PXF40347.1 AMSH-like ubiquitin thioesterase 1 [Gracilariopsis chorda]
MPLEDLFDRSPVLPPDPNISLARYLHTIRQNYQAAITQPDAQRSALLHIRLLQLICKTLPTHPEYSLPENKPLLKELRSIAHKSFEALEVFDEPVHHREPSRVDMSASLLDLFERIASDSTTRGHSTIGLLGGRMLPQPHVAALVMPSQTCGTICSSLRYENDVSQLMEVKDLLCFGLIHISPTQPEMGLPVELESYLSHYSNSVPEAFAIVIVPASEKRVRFYSCGNDGKVGVAHHVDVRNDGVPSFKLYDLRPLAIARDEQQER